MDEGKEIKNDSNNTLENSSTRGKFNLKNKKVTEQLRKNPWILSTFVIGLIAMVLVVGSFSNLGLTGKVVSENKAGNNLIAYLNTIVDDEVTLVDVESEGAFYKVTVEYQGQDIPIYVTRDGAYYTSSLIPIVSSNSGSNTNVNTEIPKSDVPEVELFIWGYCPYGVQAQGPLAEVASLLSDYADFKAVLYYDGHGAFETQQNKIQECIQEISPDKYWDYAAGFVEDIYPACSSSRDVNCDKTQSITLMNSLGINSNAVLNCVNSNGESLLSDASSHAQELGVTGSPTLVINGVKANVDRTAEAFKIAVCNAFTDAPELCSTVLDDTGATTSGNC